MLFNDLRIDKELFAKLNVDKVNKLSNLYHSTSQTFITVGKHTKNTIALACPELVSCVALIFILECCAAGSGTQNPLFPSRKLLHHCN